MGRAPCCSKVGLHRGPWSPREDTLLTKYIQTHGEGHWRSLPKKAGLLRCGKSCRLRWMNYLRPDIKRGNITPDEDDLIIRLHSLLGNRWSLIAGRLPGRTDNEIKNYWNTHLSKKLMNLGTDPNTHKKLSNNHQHQKQKSRKSSTTSTRTTNINNKKINKKLKKKNNGNVEPTKPTTTESTTKHKIHLPKPTRVTLFSLLPRNESFECNTTFSGSSSRGIEGGGGGGGGENPHSYNAWGDGVGFFIGDDQDHDHQNVFNGSDDQLECQSYVIPPTTTTTTATTTTDDNSHTLEKLYDEYLQLLKNEEDKLLLGSFTESFLI